MALKKIVVISTTNSQPNELHSEASTYGQLKDSLREFGDLDKMRAVIKESKTTLELNDAVLPDSDFTLFLTPKQIKAGAINIAEVLRSLRDKINNAFNDAIEEVEDGEHDEEDDCEDYVAPRAKSAGPVISNEDRDFMNQLSNLR